MGTPISEYDIHLFHLSRVTSTSAKNGSTPSPHPTFTSNEGNELPTTVDPSLLTISKPTTTNRTHARNETSEGSHPLKTGEKRRRVSNKAAVCQVSLPSGSSDNGNNTAESSTSSTPISTGMVSSMNSIPSRINGTTKQPEITELQIHQYHISHPIPLGIASPNSNSTNSNSNTSSSSSSNVNSVNSNVNSNPKAKPRKRPPPSTTQSNSSSSTFTLPHKKTSLPSSHTNPNPRSTEHLQPATTPHQISPKKRISPLPSSTPSTTFSILSNHDHNHNHGLSGNTQLQANSDIWDLSQSPNEISNFTERDENVNGNVNGSVNGNVNGTVYANRNGDRSESGSGSGDSETSVEIRVNVQNGSSSSASIASGIIPSSPNYISEILSSSPIRHSTPRSKVSKKASLVSDSRKSNLEIGANGFGISTPTGEKGDKGEKVGNGGNGGKVKSVKKNRKSMVDLSSNGTELVNSEQVGSMKKKRKSLGDLPQRGLGLVGMNGMDKTPLSKKKKKGPTWVTQTPA